MAPRFLHAIAPYVSPPVLVGLMAGYLAMVVLLSRVMRDRQPLLLSTAMRVYNVMQIVVCAYMCWGLFPLLLTAPTLHIHVFGMRLWLPNIFVVNLAFSAEAEFFVFVHYLSKALDFCDTVFIILRKKTSQLSFLHVYHHSTIIVIWGYLLHVGCGGGVAVFGAFLNSLVHVLMYTHYLLTTYGLHNPFKTVLTRVQISQFYLCVAQAAVVAGSGLEHVMPPALALIQLGYHCTMVILFSDFLSQSAGGKDRKRL